MFHNGIIEVVVELLLLCVLWIAVTGQENRRTRFFSHALNTDHLAASIQSN